MAVGVLFVWFRWMRPRDGEWVGVPAVAHECWRSRATDPR